jgi:L-alanine-DL-glutamate epimerase-like enolase superfamily enzyme
MRNTARARSNPLSLGRREFLRTLGATTVGAAGITGMMGPLDFARAATTPGENGIYITDLRTATIGGLSGPATIIRLDTNKGISGYGEARDTNYSLSELAALKPIVVGMNPTQVDKVFDAIKSVGNPTSNPTNIYQTNKTGGICAVEMACWDITGKVYNVPVWKLIGPKLRDKIRLYCDTPQQSSIAALQSVVRTRLNQGFTWFKMDLQRSYLSGSDYSTSPETGLPYPAIRIKDSGYTKWANYAAAYRSMIGAAPLSSDHYQNYASTTYLDMTSSIALANLMAGSSYQGMSGGWMEDIAPWWYPDQSRQVNEGTIMPILTGEDMYCLDEFQALIDAGAVNYIHPDQSTAGGIHQTSLAAQYAWEHGVRTALHCSGATVAFVCSLHIAAGIPEFLSLEHHHVDVSWYESLVDGIEKPIMQNGYAAVPEGPGLGIVPNAAAISAHLASGGYFTQ